MNKTAKAFPAYFSVALLCLISCLTVLIGRLFFLPSINKVINTYPNTKKITTPFLMEVPDFVQVARFKIFLQREILPIDSISFRADDLLTTIREPDNEYFSRIASCSYPIGCVYRFSKPLKQNINEIEPSIKNYSGEGSLAVAPDPTDIGYAVIAIIILIAAVILGRSLPSACSVTFVFFTVGILVRLCYLAHTPPWMRQYDFDGHLEYVASILFNWKIPAVDAGWETQQAPLYYTLAALFLKALTFFGRDLHNAAGDLQVFSWCIELVGLTVVVVCLQRYKTHSKELYYAVVSFLVVFPGWVMLSPRVSNEPLFHTLTLISLVALFTWWRKHSWTNWWFALFFCCLASLTKITGLIFLPLYGFCLMYRLYQSKQVTRSLQILFSSLALVIALLGWFVWYRFITASKLILGVSHAINDSLKVPSGFWEMVIFRPNTMLIHPYAETWSSDDDLRKNFWEFLFRSAFFGEFSFGREMRYLAALILLAAMFVVATFIFSLRRLVLNPNTKLALVIVATWLAAAMAYRYHDAYSCNQDFRFITPALFPFVICLLHTPTQKLQIAFVSFTAAVTFVFWISWFSLSTLS